MLCRAMKQKRKAVREPKWLAGWLRNNVSEAAKERSNGETHVGACLVEMKESCGFLFNVKYGVCCNLLQHCYVTSKLH